MPEWLVGLLLGTSGGGLLGYLFRGWIDDRFARQKEARQFKRTDILALRDGLHQFLGEPRAHFSWLEDTPDVAVARAVPSPAEKAQIIAQWVYANAPKYPKDRRGPRYLITNVAYQLARGDRHFLDRTPNGYEVLLEAWNTLDEYAQDLTRQLHSGDSV